MSVTLTTLQFVVGVLGTSAAGSLITYFLGGRRNAIDARRNGYSVAMDRLVSWQEYAYRVSRRPKGNGEFTASLVQLGSDLQEELAKQQMWVSLESRRTGRAYGMAIASIREASKEPIKTAWSTGGISDDKLMNVGDLGTYTESTEAAKRAFARSASYRFGPARIGSNIANLFAGRRTG
jgi:hypothetical protein